MQFLRVMVLSGPVVHDSGYILIPISDSRKIQKSDSGSDSDSRKKSTDSIPIPILASLKTTSFDSSLSIKLSQVGRV